MNFKWIIDMELFGKIKVNYLWISQNVEFVDRDLFVKV